MKKKVLLVGQPNVGKSTLFNTLTGMHQHTGNWTGKTVDFACGSTIYKENKIEFIDLPGTYSLHSYSKEEEITTHYIESNQYDVIVLVSDAITLRRSLELMQQVLLKNKKVIMVINLMDEAIKKGIFIQFQKLKNELHIPIIPISAKEEKGIDILLEEILFYEQQNIDIDYRKVDVNEIVNNCVKYTKPVYDEKSRKLDYILTSKSTGIPIMLGLLFFILWITIYLSNFPSNWLFTFFNYFETVLAKFFLFLKIPALITSLLLDGVYKTVTWVISVMLPPMLIFFPLFTILEDYGILPRISFNMDHLFSKCNTCGKQCLTMLMGFGCNAVGVTGTRIIESKKEKLIAILTNSFVPCNGRFPTIIAMISIFLVHTSNHLFSSWFSAFFLTLVILFSIFITLWISKILSKLLLNKTKSTFILELPQYRRPKFVSVITHSLLDRTLFILGKAITISIPAGIFIYLLANLSVGDTNLLSFLAGKFDGIGFFLGLDGMILLAFILGFPANEIVIPILLMGYLKSGVLMEYESLEVLKNVLVTNGWTVLTAINFMIMTLFHFPCSTTLISIKKETGSNLWCFVSVLIPLIMGISICLIVKLFWQLF